MPVTSSVFSSPRLAHVSLGLAGLMWVVPFLNYYHAYPLTTFYQEWGAVMLGFGAMPLLLAARYWGQPEVPRVVLLPIGFMLLVLVQFALGKIPYFDQAMLFTLYLLWAALLIMLGRSLREEFGLPVLATVLAAFLVVGAELSAVVGVIQHYGWRTFLDPVVTVKTSAAVYGNVAQPNHFADYITLGLASLGLLHVRWRLRIRQTVLLVAPLLFVLVLSGSRSAWVYLLCMTVMAFFWQRRDKSCRPLLYYSALLVLGFALMHLVVQIPWLGGPSSVTTVGRMVGEVSAGAAASGSGGAMGSGSIRLHIWREAWLIFLQFPVLGAGFGQFAWQHFQLGPVVQNAGITGLYNNAHNLVMQVAAETGLAGLLVLFGTLVLWIRQVRNAPRDPYHWWGCALLAVLGIHSLLEYPLWYAYFVGIAALTLGMLDGTAYRLQLRSVGRLSVAAVLLLGMLSMSQLWLGYRKLEGLMAMRPAFAYDQDYSRRLSEGLAEVHGKSLFQPYAELFMSSSMELDMDRIADRRALNERVMRFIPISPVVYREALLLALSGEQAAARMQMERAIWSYPADFQRVSSELADLARSDPAHFAALLEFALQKNEERKHVAVLAK